MEWFENWFDSPYYHTLYKNRDFKEAEDFIQRLLSELSPDEGSFALDLACGKGRHSITLNNAGLNVTGVDLSRESILHAEQFSSENLERT